MMKEILLFFVCMAFKIKNLNVSKFKRKLQVKLMLLPIPNSHPSPTMITFFFLGMVKVSLVSRLYILLQSSLLLNGQS